MASTDSRDLAASFAGAIDCEGHEASSLSPTNRVHYPALDGMRGIAVLLVFYQHYLNGVLPLDFGWVGVDIFFVLSGFLITGILHDARDNKHKLRDFYTRRALRIFPLYYAVLAGGLALAPAMHWVWHPAWVLWPFHLGNYARFIWVSDWRSGAGTLEHLRSSLNLRPPFFLYFGHFWSLCVEEQFYLVWPLVIFAVRDRVRLRNLCLAVCLLVPLLRLTCVVVLPTAYIDAELLYRVTPLRIDALLMGGALALMLRGPEARWLQRSARPLLMLYGIGVAASESVFAIATGHFYAPVTDSTFVGTIGFSLIDLGAALVILASLEPAGTLFKVLSARPFCKLGNISYGFYVFHDVPHVLYTVIVTTLFGPLDRDLLRLVIALVAFGGTLLLATVSFQFFEAPFIRLGRLRTTTSRRRFAIGAR